MANTLIEAARARRKRIEDERQRNDARDAEYAAAREELESRTFEVSMPGYDGPDSHVAIRDDKLALDEMQEEERNGIESYREQVDGASTEDRLAEIRDGLDGGSN